MLILERNLYLCTVTGLVVIYTSYFAHATSFNDSKVLTDNFLSGYNKYVRPVSNQADAVLVNITLYVMSIQEFDEVMERLSVVGILGLSWYDANMKWNPSDYGGARSFRLSYRDVWVPEMILINPSHEIDTLGRRWQTVQYFSNGLALWYPGDSLKTTCSVNVKYYPFDTQECDITFAAWGYSDTEIAVSPEYDTVKMDFLSENGAWSIKGSSTRVFSSGSVSQLTFTLIMKRKPAFIIVNILLPILFLSLLNVLVFLLPVESGERISFCITVLLSIAVFMTIISDTLPKSSEPMSIISYILMFELIISSCITFVTTLNLRLYHMNPKKKKVPSWLASCVNRKFCKRKGIAPEPKADSNDVAENTVTSILSDMNKKQLPSPQIDGLNNEQPSAIVSWQDVSSFVDWVALFAFSVLSFLTFLVFIVVIYIG